MPQQDPHKKFKQVGQRLEEIIAHSEAIDHIVNHAYYSTVEKHELYRKDNEFGKEHKDELIDGMISGLKTHLLYVFKDDEERLKRIQEHSDEDWEENLLPAYFGLSRKSLEDRFKDMDRITKQDISRIVTEAVQKFTSTLFSPELAQLQPEDVREGKKYIKALSKEIGQPYKVSRIRTQEDLQGAMRGIHAAKSEYEKAKKYAEKEEAPS